jgi:hypothetical protein
LLKTLICVEEKHTISESLFMGSSTYLFKLKKERKKQSSTRPRAIQPQISLCYLMTQFKMNCQNPLGSLIYFVIYMKTEFSLSMKKARSALILVRLREMLFFFCCCYWDNNGISNRKAIQQSFMHHNKVVLMLIRLSHLGFSVVTNW